MARTTFKKIITSDEILANIHPRNQYLVKSFIKAFNTTAAPTSVKNYKSDYNIFFSWNYLENDNKPFEKIKKSELISFFSYAVNDLQWGSSRYKRMHSALSMISRHIENILDEDDDDYKNFRNLMPKISKVPNAFVREKTVLSETQVNNLLEHLKKTNIQHACLFALMISSGARISECFRFRTEHIDENNLSYGGYFLATKKEIKTKGRGKSGKMLTKHIIKDIFLPVYKDWLIERERILKDKGVDDHGFIFLTRDGKPASDRTSRRWIEQFEKYLTEKEPSNINKEQVHFYAHSCRHFVVSTMYRAGFDTDLIVSIMGWAKESGASMAALYSDVLDSERDWKNVDKLGDYIKNNLK